MGEVHSVAAKANISKKDADSAINAILETISEELVKGEEVSFIGFGSFSRTLRAARKARVPGTDKIVDLPETKTVKFKVGKALKKAVSLS
jgi:DNA-binding protein HU-beta